jgi:broad specificity phosphatase PhoE
MRETVDKAAVELSAKEKTNLIELAFRVYEGLTEDEIDNIERIALDRNHPWN